MSRFARIARHALWPVFVLASTAAFAFGFEHLGLLLTFPLVATVQFLCLVAAEAALPLNDSGTFRRDPETNRDVFHNIVGQGFGNQLGATLVIGATALLAGLGGERFGASLWPAHWPFVVQVLVLVFLADGIECLRHRAEHTVPLLWRAHALHHSVDRMHVLKSGRGHFLDMVFRHAVVFLPFAVIGTPVEVMAWYAAATSIFGPIAHANIDVRLPGFVHKLFMTPQGHHLHHARGRSLALSNYANVFALWDVIFGTFADPVQLAPDGYGIEDDRMPRTLWGQLAAPFVRG